MFTRLDEKGGNIYAPLLVCPVQQVSGAGMSEAYIDDITGYVFESNAAGGLHPFTDDICLGAPEPTTHQHKQRQLQLPLKILLLLSMRAKVDNLCFLYIYIYLLLCVNFVEPLSD